MSKESKLKLYRTRLELGLCPSCGRVRDKLKANGKLCNLCSICLGKVHKPSLRELENRKHRQYGWKIRLAAIAMFGNKCVRCGFNDPRALQFDHIHGDGFKEKGKYYIGFLKRLLANPDFETYQLLCANCNWIKRYENNENPNVQPAA